MTRWIPIIGPRETDNGINPYGGDIEPVDPDWPREGHGGGIDGKTGL